MKYGLRNYILSPYFIYILPGLLKSCGDWKEYQDNQQIRHTAQEGYLRYYFPRCAQITRRLKSPQAKRLAW